MSSLIKQFKMLGSDKDRWQWVIDNKDKDIRLVLLKNTTYVVDENPPVLSDFDDKSQVYSRFNDSIGDTSGIKELLDVIGIDWH